MDKIEFQCLISGALLMMPEATPKEMVEKIEYLWECRSKLAKEVCLLRSQLDVNYKSADAKTSDK